MLSCNLQKPQVRQKPTPQLAPESTRVDPVPYLATQPTEKRVKNK
jgi:hypothetical protein